MKSNSLLMFAAWSWLAVAGFADTGEESFCHQAVAAFAGAESVGDRKYAPDRKVDILHLALDVTPDFEKSTVRGEATLTFKPISKPLDELRLDAVDLTVSNVRCSATLAGHQVTGKEIIVTFAPPIPRGARRS